MASIASIDAAPQHGPRPLPLFLGLVQKVAAEDPARAGRILAGLAAYQAAPRQPPATDMPIAAAAGRARLLDYGGGGRPVIFVPSLINPPAILDIAPHHSMLRWLAANGVHPLLVDWGTPGIADRGMDIAGHVEQLLLPLIDTIGPDAALAGYCLGGTMAMAAAAIASPSGLILIASPWHFSAFPDQARADLAALWAAAKDGVDAMQCLPMEVLQSAFWRLDPDRTLDKFAAFGALDPDSAAARMFVAIEDWANEGAPLTGAAGRDLFEHFFAADHPGRGQWRVGGRAIDPAALATPLFDIVSTSDRIVPAAAATGRGTRLALDAGHVGMVVGRGAETLLWRPLLSWLSQLRHS